jgi:HEAT repeat protein
MPLIRKPAVPAVGSTTAGPSGLKGLDSGDPQERWSAARAAADIPGTEGALAIALPKEDDSRVREALFTSLGRIGTQESVNALVCLLHSDVASLRTGALDSLRIIARKSAGFLPGLLRDSDADVRLLSCELARDLPSEEATTLLSALLLAEEEVNVCAAAIDVLAEVGNPQALPALSECAKRFAAAPFIGFAIKIATDRINAQPSRPRG